MNIRMIFILMTNLKLSRSWRTWTWCPDKLSYYWL